MSGEAFNILCGIVSLVAFIFALWKETQTRELRNALSGIAKIASRINWEMQTHAAEDVHARLRQAEKALGLVGGIHVFAQQHSGTSLSPINTELQPLLERKVIWTTEMMWNVETSSDVHEIWLWTPDLRPDATEPDTGRVVAANLDSGKRYVYFIPDDLPHRPETVDRLLHNIAPQKKETAPVTVVDVAEAHRPEGFESANLIIYHHGDGSYSGPAAVFQELRFTALPQRGHFWQEADEHDAEAARRYLHEAWEAWNEQVS